MTPPIIARGKSLYLGRARIARCGSRGLADLLALYARSSALLSTPSLPFDPLATLAAASVALQIATLEKALLQTVTLKPLDETPD